MPRARNIRFTGAFQSRDEAAASLKMTGDAALVQRGVPRMLLLSCPCGCGEILVVNLDKRAGPAWRMYQRGKAVSLFPSYWRDSKCASHFIVWSNNVYWCDLDDDGLWTRPSVIQDRVCQALPDYFIKYEQLAEQLGEIPWEVLLACHALVRKGEAVVNQPGSSGEFRRAKPSPY
jgi:hypothetical protein